ncbi:MAG TPA: DUF2970 domain-containing protein [Aeromonadales bacterium]|nr:DUF2970 domain-containing protein [Aeromonadales bacterium]
MPNGPAPKTENNQAEDVSPVSGQTDEHPLTSSSTHPTNKNQKKLSFFQMFFSTMAAMVGIQTKANLERDFEHGSAGNFVVIGLILVAIFIFTLVKVVGMVLDNAGI